MGRYKLLNLFVKNLRRLLADRRPAWLAKASGLSPSTVGRLLNGEMSPALDSLESLADALEVHPAEFISEPGASHLVQRTVSLEEDQVEAIKNIFRTVQEEERVENPEAVALSSHLPKDIQHALIDYEGDWDLLRAALDIPNEPVTKKKSPKASS